MGHYRNVYFSIYVILIFIIFNLQFTCDKTQCYKKEGNGNSFHQPWVDGTECANEKWCQRGKCVEKSSGNSGQSFWNSGMDKIDGGWGEWE